MFWRGRGDKASREEGCVFCEFSSRRNGQRKRWERGKEDLNREMVEEEFKEVHGSYDPETFKRMLSVAK